MGRLHLHCHEALVVVIIPGVRSADPGLVTESSLNRRGVSHDRDCAEIAMETVLPALPLPGESAMSPCSDRAQGDLIAASDGLFIIASWLMSV